MINNSAKDTCKELLDKDPNRLDIVDMYSNILYVKDDKAALNYLAHHTVEVGHVLVSRVSVTCYCHVLLSRVRVTC